MENPAQYLLIDFDVGTWIEAVVAWIQQNLPAVLEAIADFIGFFVDNIEDFFFWVNPFVMAAIIIAIGLWRVGKGFAIYAVVACYLFMQMDLWQATMATFSLVIASAIVAVGIGLPVGIAMSRRERVEHAIRPILDFMQTMPPFVYLIPAVIFFGLGKVPGAIATVVFSMAPVTRLTNLGIRQVPVENIEAGIAFGCTPRQLLSKVQIPLALPTIMQGVNQTIMLGLSMVVIASMIGAGGLGTVVLTGIQRLNVGLGFEGGLGVVLIAILLDRITQTFGDPHRMGGGGSSLMDRIKSLFGRPPEEQKETATDEKVSTSA